MQYIGENMFLEDSTLLNCLLEDELLQIDNENVYAAVIEYAISFHLARY